MGARVDGRIAEELREIKITRRYIKHAEGSALMEMGDTKVICTASLEERVPLFLRGQNTGWITAEYAMIPRATETRSIRESSRGRVGGRTQEIQRLIGRALRSVVNLKALGENTIWIDCDVIQADGGTRTAAITGAYVALVDALSQLKQMRKWEALPVTDYLAAVSVGIVQDELLLDLCYAEDARAQVDFNVVMTGSGSMVELQGAAETQPFSREQLDQMVNLAEQGVGELIRHQRSVLTEDLQNCFRS